MAKGQGRSEVLQGTLDLMVLKTLDAIGPQHGYGVARRIGQISDDILQLNEGTVYASLLRLRQRRWISSSWGRSENNRKAKFYTITESGRRQLASETQDVFSVQTGDTPRSTSSVSNRNRQFLSVNSFGQMLSEVTTDTLSMNSHV